ncbi:MAG TPA: methyltransferase domain-containing protein [Pyrinomonadaceae bacterium]|nr:methyltransferase domain-containing protein [Pyrinomonadaceae bacterium]
MTGDLRKEADMGGWIPQGFASREAWREHVLSRGCYDARENERIFNKWFRNAPKVVFRRADALYDLRRQTLCDVGCCYGANLFFSRPDSYGLEMNGNYVRFARGLGLNVHERNVVEDDLTDLPRVDVVWCSAVIEHVDSPHILLRKLHLLLKPRGLLLLFAPIFPLVSSLSRLPRYGKNFTSHLHDDHVSAFTTKTLRFTCERAGFETVELTALYRRPFSVFNRTLFLPATCMYVGRARADWDYPTNSSRRSATNVKGFISRNGGRPFEADPDA